jgi:hypothetical protein
MPPCPFYFRCNCSQEAERKKSEARRQKIEAKKEQRRLEKVKRKKAEAQLPPKGEIITAVFVCLQQLLFRVLTAPVDRAQKEMHNLTSSLQQGSQVRIPNQSVNETKT